MHDLAPYLTDRRVTAVAHNARTVTVQWDDGQESAFHAAWLRDNRACSACRDPQTMARTFQLVNEAGPIVIRQARSRTASGTIFEMLRRVALARSNGRAGSASTKYRPDCSR
jgi:gamma-butyrobetaine dioxygenase